MGGTGSISQGFVVGDFTGAGDALGDLAPGIGLSLGGEGHARVGPILLIGKGFGIFGLDGESVDGAAHSGGGGGAFDIGYRLPTGPDIQVHPFLGVQFQGVGVIIENNSTEALSVGDGSVAPGGRAELQGGGIGLELGAGFEWMPSPSGGLCVGYEISGILPLSASD